MKFEAQRTLQREQTKQAKGHDMNTNATRTDSFSTSKGSKPRLNSLLAGMIAIAFATLSLSTLFHVDTASADDEVELYSEHNVDQVRYQKSDETWTDWEDADVEDCSDHGVTTHTPHECDCDDSSSSSSSSSAASAFSSSGWQGYWANSAYYRPTAAKTPATKECADASGNHAKDGTVDGSRTDQTERAPTEAEKTNNPGIIKVEVAKLIRKIRQAIGRSSYNNGTARVKCGYNKKDGFSCDIEFAAPSFDVNGGTNCSCSNCSNCGANKTARMDDPKSRVLARASYPAALEAL